MRPRKGVQGSTFPSILALHCHLARASVERPTTPKAFGIDVGISHQSIASPPRGRRIPPIANGKSEERPNARDLLATVNSASSGASTSWIAFLGSMAYLAVTLSGVTHVQLLLNEPTALPFVNVKVPLDTFFVAGPLAFVLLHFGLLLLNLTAYLFEREVNETTGKSDSLLGWSRNLIVTDKDLLGDDKKETRLSLRGRDFRYATLDRSQLTRSDFYGAKLGGARLVQTDLNSAKFRAAQFQGANLTGAQLQGADLSEADLQGADFKGAGLQGADFTVTRLQGADLSDARLQGANLNGANLQGADFTLARMQGANLSLAHLQGANLTGARLQGADLTGAGLQGANLSLAQLQGANLTGAGL
jgi:uncharacterized protein YjbI with pentapeptide repeats